MEKTLSFFGIVIITSFIFFETNLYPQIVTGNLVDENNFGLADINLELYTSDNVYNSTSLADGSFSFNLVTNIDEEGQLPSGYNITNNFPNPFNPTTRLGITLPGDANVRVNIYNILGQKVSESIQEYYTAGTHFLDIELFGLSSGIYIAQISIDEKYTVNKKMMLVYGSQHLNSLGGTLNSTLNKPNLYKSNLSENIDSLVASSLIIGRKTFTDLQSLSGDTTNLGNLTIERFCPGIPTVIYEGKTYNTVLIGDQCWLKENLDVGIMINSTGSGFQQTNNGILEKYCYDNNPTYCETYGGLYEWPEAMQYTIMIGIEGICPPGWHIPTIAEFETLSLTVGEDGNALKAKGQGAGGGVGTNTSGFSALFTGGRGYDGAFYSLGVNTLFWSSTEYDVTFAYTLGLGDVESGIFLSSRYKPNGFSVRCLKDEETAPTPPILNFPYDGDTTVGVPTALTWNPSSGATSYTLQVSTSNSFATFVFNLSGLTGTTQLVTGLNNSAQYYWRVSATNSYGISDWSSVWNFTTTAGGGDPVPCPGIPTVTYAGKTYNTVLIGDQCWLIENLDVGTIIQGSQDQTNNGTIEKYCYDNDPNNCNTYGGLYQWNEAMQYVTNEGAQGICPPGWHIPALAEFVTLKTTVNNDGDALKATGQGGTNTSGFSALLAGYRYGGGNFSYLGGVAHFWSSTEYSWADASTLYLYGNGSNINLYYVNKEYGFSMRCLKD